MDTATAAQQAGVTIATVQLWCRIGAVAAKKAAGRWVIVAASLARRIEIGRQRMAQPRYIVQPVERESMGKIRTYHAVVRSDGTPTGFGPGKDYRIHNHVYERRELAEIAAEFFNETPDHYKLERRQGRHLGGPGSWEWMLTGSREGDPLDARARLSDDWTPTPGSAAEGERPVDMLIGWALAHEASADARIAAHAEKKAIAEAEREVREAREAQLAELRRTKGQLATPRQVDYILNLLEQRRISGEGGGFYSGPTDRAGIEELSKNEASVYITSLKGDY